MYTCIVLNQPMIERTCMESGAAAFINRAENIHVYMNFLARDVA